MYGDLRKEPQRWPTTAASDGRRLVNRAMILVPVGVKHGENPLRRKIGDVTFGGCDQLIEMFVEPGVGKIVLVDGGDAQTSKRPVGLGGPVCRDLHALVTTAENHGGHFHARCRQLGKRSAAPQFEVVGVSPQGENFVHFDHGAGLNYDC